MFPVFRNTGKYLALEMWFLFSGFEADCVILSAAFALTNLSLYPWLPAVFRILVSQILDRTEPVLYSSMSSETITVFQYYNYFASHSVNDLGNYLLQLAKEGRVHKFCCLVREYIPALLSSTQSSSEPWGWFYKRRREKRQRSVLTIKWMYLNCRTCQGKGTDADRPSVISISTLKWEKTVLKAWFFRKWLMVVGWAQGLGSFLCPQFGWCLGLSPSVMGTFWSAEQFSGTKVKLITARQSFAGSATKS